MSRSDPAPLRPTAPAVFAATIVPFAAAVGYGSLAVPRWLEDEHVSLAVMGVVSAITMAPHAVKVLWAPLVDLVGGRKAWYLWTTLATAALLGVLGLLPDLTGHLVLFTVLCTSAQIAGTTAAVAADGLMASTTRTGDKGKAGGFRMAGNVGGTGVLGALAIELAAHADRRAACLVLSAVTLVSMAAVLPIHEARRARGEAAALREALHRLREIVADLFRTLVSRQGWTGLVICAVPVGAGALTNLFSGMGASYHASLEVVARVNGLAGGALGALGSLAGGVLADRMNRRLAYAVSGGLTALTAMGMFLGPLTQGTYAWGTLAYNFANGMAFATLAALILDMVGHSPAAATKYTAFIAVSNLASSYVTYFDGLGSEVGGLGVRGTVLADVVMTALGIVALLAMVAVTRREGARARGGDGRALAGGAEPS
ncbi:MAG TPA: MFS transporter [Anaeromyxobacter sp.]|nr:MFS transporter [Anaeromyxobacter sp.]